MYRRRLCALGSLASMIAGLGVACGSSSDDASGGGADAAAEAASNGTASGDGAARDADVGDDGGGQGDDASSASDAGDAGDAGDGDAGDGSVDGGGALDGATPPITRTLATGGYHTCVIVDDGAVRCWGSNSRGQLGSGGDAGGTSGPVSVVGISDAVELTAGGEFTCARLAGGNVKCWGDGRYLGTGNAGGVSTVPVDVVGLTDAVSISARSYHTCAMRSNRRVACWGANYGRIGDGTTADRLTPTEPIGPMDAGTVEDAVHVGTGWGQTCIVRTNGTMTCSGEYNAWGQLGDGTTQNRYSPTAVQNISSAVEVGIGCYTACARLASGQMQCWGNNQAGQLGLGVSDQDVHGSPTDVPGMTQVAQTSPSCFGTCALTQSQQVYCWGGAVGLSSSPSLVATSGPAAEVSGGNEHACARLVTGAIQCWGKNTEGQLGNGTDAGASPSGPTTVTGL